MLFSQDGGETRHMEEGECDCDKLNTKVIVDMACKSIIESSSYFVDNRFYISWLYGGSHW